MSINSILNTSFKISKVVSVLMAFFLLLALGAGIALFSTSLLSTGGGYESFEESFARAANMDQAEGSADGADTFKSTNARIEIENEYGKDLQAAIKAAQCPDPTGTYDALIGLAEAKSADDGFSKSKYFKFLERYLYDFAEAGIKNPNLNKEFFCRENIGDIIQRHDAERLANEAKKTTTLMVSAAMIGGTILLIFILMVIPAIYRIEEHLRPKD